MNFDTIKNAVYKSKANLEVGYNFTVYFDAFKFGFSKVSNIEDSVETDTLVEGGVNDRVYSLRRPVTSERVMVFERGRGSRGAITMLTERNLKPGKRITCDTLIIVHDQNGKHVRDVFALSGCYVKSWKLSDFDARNSDALIETFEIAYEKAEFVGIAATVLGLIT